MREGQSVTQTQKKRLKSIIELIKMLSDQALSEIDGHKGYEEPSELMACAVREILAYSKEAHKII